MKVKLCVIFFPACHALPYKEKPFPFPLGLAAPVDVWCCVPPCSPGPSCLSLAPGFPVPPAAIRTPSAELIYGPVSGGSGVEGGEEGPVEKVEREGICHSSCLEPDAPCTFSGGCLHTALPGDAGLSKGWVIYGKLGNSSFISYKQSKYLLQKIRLQDNHTSGHSSVKIYYVLGSVPF